MTVDEALRAAGLPEPKKDGPDEAWSPGSGGIPLDPLEQLFRDALRATGMKPAVNEFWTAAYNFILRRDPLSLDLDGDGIETVSK